jgi:hypothetical protein
VLQHRVGFLYSGGKYTSLRWLMNYVSPEHVRMEQLHWLRDRDACGADTECLARGYQDRLQQLVQASGWHRWRRPGPRCFRPAEIAICSDPQLSYLDNQLSPQHSTRIMSTTAADARAIKTARSSGFGLAIHAVPTRRASRTLIRPGYSSSHTRKHYRRSLRAPPF